MLLLNKRTSKSPLLLLKKAQGETKQHVIIRFWVSPAVGIVRYFVERCSVRGQCNTADAPIRGMEMLAQNNAVTAQIGLVQEFPAQARQKMRPSP